MVAPPRRENRRGGAGRGVAIADVENIERSARDAGIALHIPSLTGVLAARGAQELWAVLTSHAGTARLESAYAQAGWRVVGGHARTSDGSANAELSIATVPREGRNILRLMFGSDHVRARNAYWDSIARFVVGAFRADVARAGANNSVAANKLVAELSRLSPEFEALWQDNDVVAHGEGMKRIHHPDAGLLAMEFSSFAVEGRPELGMIVYNPASSSDADRLRRLLEVRAP